MTLHLLITAVGTDRPGLVDELSQQLADRDLNIETSRMAHLGGEFAMLLLVTGPTEKIADLAEDPTPLAADTGLQLSVRQTETLASASAAIPYSIVTAGMDNPGIVQRIASVLHRFQVGIESMDTGVGYAANSGTPIFNMKATISASPEVRIRLLREALTELGDELNMDIDLTAI